MNLDLLIVDNNYNTFDFLLDNETAEEGIKRAENSRNESIARYREFMAGEYASDYFENQVKKEKERTFKIMEFDDFIQKQKAYLCGGEPKEISKEEYEDALNCLPPVGWMQGDSCDWFFMSEMYTGTITNQYYFSKRSGKYYCKLADIFDRSTWIDLR